MARHTPVFQVFLPKLFPVSPLQFFATTKSIALPSHGYQEALCPMQGTFSAGKADGPTHGTPQSQTRPPLSHGYDTTLTVVVGEVAKHTSAYVSIRQHTSASVSRRPHMPAYVSMRPRTSAYAGDATTFTSRRRRDSP